MAYNRWGMHGPNKDPTAISSMVAMGLDCYTVVDKWEQVRQIRVARPNAIILLRPYFTGGLANDPVETAKRACDHALQFMDQTHHLVIGNELNIEGPFEADDPDSWKEMNEWVLRTAGVVRRNLPQAVLHFPGISPGVGDDPDIMDPPGLEYCREAVEECDVLDQHVYWPGREAPAWAWEQRFEPWYGRRLLWHHALFPEKYLFLSECGPDDVRPLGTAEDIIQWFGILEREFPYWLGSALFMWNWGKKQDYLNYYDKPWLTEPLRITQKKLFEMPTSWVFEGEEEVKVKIWRRDLVGSPVVEMLVGVYLWGVVCAEMFCAWLLEALKVQAVAARTYVLYHWEHGGKHPAQGAILCTKACCQAYNKDRITDKSIRAVKETEGIHLLDANNKVIQAEYISKCGLPQCPYCEGRPGHDGKQWPGRMCQYGAKVSAEQGMTWREILKFYYPHAHLSDEESPGPPPPPEGDIVERLLEELDAYLPPWVKWTGFNPDTGLARAARLAQPPLGLAFSGELRKWVGSKPMVYQFFWRGMCYCEEDDYDNIQVARY